MAYNFSLLHAVDLKLTRRSVLLRLFCKRYGLSLLVWKVCPGRSGYRG